MINSEKTVTHIVNWLKQYAEKAHAKGFVVGISGGIDSAVTSSLAALTKMPVLCLEMPIYQHVKQVNRGHKHIEQLKSKFNNVTNLQTDLTPIFDSFLKALSTNKDNESEALALVNLRARMRMTALYYHAQKNSFLVVGTGNKIEDFGVGFYTKYGDGGVDISPIADLTKTEVYALGEFLGVNNDIMVAPPTDGLWGDERTDEEQIGATYPELEWAMDFVNTNSTETNLTDRQKEVLAIYKKLNAANQHKMNPIPVCIIPDELKN
ncbi:MAG: NAD synthetase [Flavobacteriales bacterium BRH_c54]|nr:MAG: NAD synthetase [Flavobacteriales bacterium BRH_c54]